TKKWYNWALFAVAVAFLIGTGSKTSMGLLGVALLAGGFYRLIGKGGLDRIIAFTALTLIGIVALGYVAANWETIVAKLNDPLQFTGRAAIWHAELRYIGDHPFFGAGFGTFANTGARSPLFGYMGEKWIGTVWHGHSGYLELMVTIGLIGFVLAMIGVVIQP